MGRVLAGCQLTGSVIISPQERPVIRVCTVLDDFLYTFSRILASEVCDPVLCDDDIDIMLAIIHMGYHGHDP